METYGLIVDIPSKDSIHAIMSASNIGYPYERIEYTFSLRFPYTIRERIMERKIGTAAEAVFSETQYERRHRNEVLFTIVQFK